MIQELSDRNLRTVVASAHDRELLHRFAWEECGSREVEVESALLHQQEHACGGERLGHARNFERVRRSHRVVRITGCETGRTLPQYSGRGRFDS